jgi:hypothetical protein
MCRPRDASPRAMLHLPGFANGAGSAGMALQLWRNLGERKGRRSRERVPRSVWYSIELCFRSDLYQVSPSTYGCSGEHPGNDLLDIVCHQLDATNCSRGNSYCKIFSVSTRLCRNVVAAMQLNDAATSAAVSSRSMVRGRSFFRARCSNGRRCLRYRRRAAIRESALPSERTGCS